MLAFSSIISAVCNRTKVASACFCSANA